MRSTTDSGACWAIAHRGTPREFPENTIAGFDRALEYGCDGIEFDVQLSRDDVPVIYHDRTLAHAGGGRRRVHQLDLIQLQRLNAGIPRLEALLERYAGRTRLLVEIKSREGLGGAQRHRQLAAHVATRLRDAVPPGTAWVLSFDAAVLATVAEVAPELPRVLNVRPALPGLGLKLRRAKPHIVDADVRGLTAAFGARVRRGSRELWSYTCNTPATLRRAQVAGARAVISDRVDWLLAQLRQR